MKRPGGFTFLSLVFAWLSIAGFGNAWVIFSGTIQEMPVVLAPFALAYGIAAGASAVGFWRFRSWVQKAIRSWMIVCLIFMLVFALYFSDFILGGALGLIGFLIFFGLLFLLLDHYVYKKINSVT